MGKCVAAGYERAKDLRFVEKPFPDLDGGNIPAGVWTYHPWQETAGKSGLWAAFCEAHRHQDQALSFAMAWRERRFQHEIFEQMQREGVQRGLQMAEAA
jgi:hypothetical protein